MHIFFLNNNIFLCRSIWIWCFNHVFRVRFFFSQFLLLYLLYYGCRLCTRVILLGRKKNTPQSHSYFKILYYIVYDYFVSLLLLPYLYVYCFSLRTNLDRRYKNNKINELFILFILLLFFQSLIWSKFDSMFS